MRKIDRRTWAAVLAIVATLGIVAWLYLRPVASAPPPAAAPAPAPIAAAPTSRPGPALGAAPAAGQAPARPAIPMPSAMVKVLDDNPHLGQYYRLQQKVLPTEDERAALRAMLSDVELIQTIKDELLAKESIYSKELETKRMVGVEFLTDAVSWTDNPEMATVTEAIESVVFADNIPPEASEDLAQSLAGDKMELYTQMLHRAPARAALLAEHAHGKSVEPFLAYSKDWYDRNMRGMKADELP